MAIESLLIENPYRQCQTKLVESAELAQVLTHDSETGIYIVRDGKFANISFLIQK